MSGTLTMDDLILGFQDVGLEQGDAALVHSSYKALGDVAGGPRTVVDALLGAVGEKGTIIMPTFNFDFCSGTPFDARSTPSHMGVLTEIVRQDPRARRVEHPIYSFAVIGRRASEAATIDDPSSYGRDSLFGKLRDWGGKIMIIGLSYNESMTFFHHVEEMEGCHYRYMKSFTGDVTDTSGHTERRTVTMLVRDLDRGVVTAVDPMGELLERSGIITTRPIGDAVVRLMCARDVYEATAREMRREPHLLYEYER